MSKTKTTRKGTAARKSVQAAAESRPLFTVTLHPHVAEFHGPDGALVSTLGNGPAGSDAAEKVQSAIDALRASHGVDIVDKTGR